MPSAILPRMLFFRNMITKASKGSLILYDKASDLLKLLHVMKDFGRNVNNQAFFRETPAPSCFPFRFIGLPTLDLFSSFPGQYFSYLLFSTPQHLLTPESWAKHNLEDICWSCQIKVTKNWLHTLFIKSQIWKYTFPKNYRNQKSSGFFRIF